MLKVATQHCAFIYIYTVFVCKFSHWTSQNSVVSVSPKLSQQMCVLLSVFLWQWPQKEDKMLSKEGAKTQADAIWILIKYLCGEYFWPRESFGNTLSVEIKRSRCQQSFISERQSQQQSEKWRRYQRDPHRSDQPSHPGSRCVFGETAGDTISLRPAGAHLIPAHFPRPENSPGIWRKGMSGVLHFGGGWGEEDVKIRRGRTHTGFLRPNCGSTFGSSNTNDSLSSSVSQGVPGSICSLALHLLSYRLNKQLTLIQTCLWIKLMLLMIYNHMSNTHRVEFSSVFIDSC